MRYIKHYLAIAAIALTTFACKNEASPEIKTVEVETTTETDTKTLDPNATYAKAEFSIDGMTCAMGCAKTIEKKLSTTDGIKSATVDFDRRLAMVEYDEAKVNATTLKETVAKAGDMYTVKDIKTVDTFSTEKTCKADCKMACCADKAEGETSACKADCEKACCKDKNKTVADHTCSAAGTKACCAGKAKA